MKKSMLSKILSVALACMVLIGGLGIGTTEAKADDVSYTANLGITDAGYWPVNDMELDSVEVKGEGTYTFKVNVKDVNKDAASSTGFKVFVIDVVGAATAFADYKVTDITITADGTTDVPVDLSKIKTGDLEGKGNYRIELYNEWGETKDAPAIDIANTTWSELEVSFTIDDPATVHKPGEMDYVANLGIADASWWPVNDMELDTLKFKGEGTYTFKVSLQEMLGSSTTSTGFKVFVIDIIGAGTALADYKVSDITVTADKTTDVPVDLTKIKTGDLEDNGNYRIELYNEYGTTKDAPAIDAVNTSWSNLELKFTIEKPAESTPSDPSETESEETTPSETESESTTPSETESESTTPSESESTAPSESEEKSESVKMDYTANLGIIDAGYWPVNGMDIDSLKFTGEGTYKFTVDVEKIAGFDGASSTGFKVFVIDIIGAAKDLENFDLKNVTVKADGVEVPVDISKILTGDIEEKGSYRIELYNEWGKTKDAPAIDAVNTTYTKLEVSFTLDDPSTTTIDSKGDAATPAFMLVLAGLAFVGIAVYSKKKTMA